jgi:hypothetical protein
MSLHHLTLLVGESHASAVIPLEANIASYHERVVIDAERMSAQAVQ